MEEIEKRVKAWKEKLPRILKDLEEILTTLREFLERVVLGFTIFLLFSLGLWTAVTSFTEGHRRWLASSPPNPQESIGMALPRPLVLPPRVPVSLRVTVTGHDGRQKLFISISGADRRPIHRGKVHVIDLHTGEIARIETNAEGIATYQVNFSNRARAFQIWATDAPDLVSTLRLAGPGSPRRSLPRSGSPRISRSVARLGPSRRSGHVAGPSISQ